MSACRRLFLTLLLTLSGAPVFAQNVSFSDAAAPPHRPADQLLTRSRLQQLADWQTAREGMPLIEALQDTAAAVRARAAFALASVQDSTAEPALLHALNDPAAAVRADVAFALGQLPSAVPAGPLLAALAREAAPTVQAELLAALGKQGDRASLDTMVQMNLPPALAADRALAVGRYALRDLHAEAAVQHLLALLNTDDPRTREHAAYYFGRSSQTEPWAPVADTVRARLDALALDDPAAMHLVLGLGRLAVPQDTTRLQHWLREARDWRIRVNAARALAYATDSAPIRAALRHQLDDSSSHVALAAAQMLAAAPIWNAADQAAGRAWIENHPDAVRINGALLHGLAAHGAPADILSDLERLRETSQDGYRYALPALAAIDHPAAFEQLARATTDEDPRLAYAALNALRSRWQSGVPADQTGAYFDVFAQALQRGDIATVYAAAPALSDSAFVARGAVDVLTTVYRTLETPKDIESMTAILDALGATGDSAAVPLLQEAQHHAHPVLRQAAAAALAKLTGTSPAPSASAPAPAPPIDWSYLADVGPYPQLVLDTDQGEIAITLLTEEAPLTTQTLLQLAEEGAYDGVPFHRVVPNFVIQGGDHARGDGFGGPGFLLRSEFTRLPYRRGTAGMASAGKDTEGSQYFIVHSMQPHLDGRYTAFGHVTDGQDVVDRIEEGNRVQAAHVVRDGSRSE